MYYLALENKWVYLILSQKWFITIGPATFKTPEARVPKSSAKIYSNNFLFSAIDKDEKDLSYTYLAIESYTFKPAALRIAPVLCLSIWLIT